MNRIWPPLITITCALVVKRFIPTVTVAVTMAICWLIVFLSGPLNQRWYKEWQETAFVFMSLLIVLFGSKSEDRQERENFLNTFGKHLKAARVQERLANMRKAMDESIAPQTALGSIIKKLNQVQQMMKGKYNSGIFVDIVFQYRSSNTCYQFFPFLFSEIDFYLK